VSGGVLTSYGQEWGEGKPFEEEKLVLIVFRDKEDGGGRKSGEDKIFAFIEKGRRKNEEFHDGKKKRKRGERICVRNF